MSLKNRPYIGTWQMSNQTLVRHTPDAIVLINGFTEFATCTTCNKALNFQEYITTVSVDATTDPISTANFSLQIPKHAADVFSHDGNYVLQPNLEVVILMRGYFPMKGFAGLGQDGADEEEFDAGEVPVYPYYQVFRGVVTEVSHEFSGGFYSATVQCANLLHFWQNLKISANGAVMGKRPEGSMVQPHLIGHQFTGANPYSIIYTLVKVGFGAAFGVDFTVSQKTSIAAESDDGRNSLYKHAAEWWEKRWTEHSGALRMYGINGQVFNAFQQAYLGRWYDPRTNGKDSSAFHQTAKRLYDSQTDANSYNLNRNAPYMEKARELGWNPYMIGASITQTGKDDYVTEDILRMQAFNMDVGKMASVNMFETEYMSKLEVAEAVKTITGYEFYQDVDGDLVFKPPMYNMDTRSDPVFRIADRDLISLTESEGEPEATVMKGTGSQTGNVTGVGLDGWLGVGGVFVDYRLVAKYGYREDTFDTAYLSSRHAIFVSAINRMDLANAGVKSCSITIPVRPELRAGYPVYIESVDCFYYAKSLSHSVAFGSDSTTTISGIAKRVKFLPPMETTGDGTFPSVDQVRLDAPDQFPAQPLIGYPEYVDGDGTEESTGPPRVYGFPNVILALDTSKVNWDTVDVDRGILTAESYTYIALNHGFLERVPGKEDTYLLRQSNETGEEVTLATIQQEWGDVADALAAGIVVPDLDTTLGQILQFIDIRLGGVDTPDVQNLINYLSLQTSLKGLFSPGTTTAGKYRYYSSNHPDELHQAPALFKVDQKEGTVDPVENQTPEAPFNSPVRFIVDQGNGRGIKKEEGSVVRGVKVAAFTATEEVDPNREATPVVSEKIMRTGDIRFITFGPQQILKQLKISEVKEGESAGTNFDLSPSVKTAFEGLLDDRALTDASLSVEERYQTEYDRIRDLITVFSVALGVSTDKNVAAKLSRYETVDKALPRNASLPLVSSDGVRGMYNTSPATAAGKVATSLAYGLWAYVWQVTYRARKLLDKDEGNYESYMEARGEWFAEVFTIVPADSSPGIRTFTRVKYETKTDHTPVFPVSDAEGYEVYGGLPYGRGVTIAHYAALLQTETSGDDDGDATETATESTTLVGTSGGSNASSLLVLEEFFAAFLVEGSASEALARLSGTSQNAILAYLNTTANDIDSALETLLHQDTSANVKIRNAPVTSFDRGQAVTGDVAAKELAHLDVDGVICACKGIDGAFFLQAFSEEYLGRYPEDPLQGFLDENTFQTTESWKASRDAMAGQALDTRNSSLAEEFTKNGEQVNTLIDGFDNLKTGLEAQGDALRNAADELQDDEG